MALTIVVASLLTLVVLAAIIVAIMTVIDASKRAKLDEFRAIHETPHAMEIDIYEKGQGQGISTNRTSPTPKIITKDRVIESTERIVVPKVIYKYDDEVTPSDYQPVITRTVETSTEMTPPERMRPKSEVVYPE